MKTSAIAISPQESGASSPTFISWKGKYRSDSRWPAEFEQSARLVEDPVISEYVDRVGQNIVKHSDAKVPFHIKVVDSDEVNAFAFPGGFFYVNKGLSWQQTTKRNWPE